MAKKAKKYLVTDETIQVNIRTRTAFVMDQSKQVQTEDMIEYVSKKEEDIICEKLENI